MENLYYKVKLYLEANSKTESEFNSNIILQNDGSGNYIHTWNVSELAQPTDDQLNALESEATTLENNNQAVSNRQKEYGSVSKQIEFITEKGLEAWKTNVQAIKTKYPKE
tara:strand:+ start:180 stop:509 length:330 start_codon:yes stop_codon:yes gene_type:complete